MKVWSGCGRWAWDEEVGGGGWGVEMEGGGVGAFHEEHGFRMSNLVIASREPGALVVTSTKRSLYNDVRKHLNTLRKTSFQATVQWHMQKLYLWEAMTNETCIKHPRIVWESW